MREARSLGPKLFKLSIPKLCTPLDSLAVKLQRLPDWGVRNVHGDLSWSRAMNQFPWNETSHTRGADVVHSSDEDVCFLWTVSLPLVDGCAKLNAAVKPWQPLLVYLLRRRDKMWISKRTMWFIFFLLFMVRLFLWLTQLFFSNKAKNVDSNNARSCCLKQWMKGPQSLLLCPHQPRTLWLRVWIKHLINSTKGGEVSQRWQYD